MWSWIILGGYALFVVVLVSCIAHVALSRHDDSERRETAFKMFRIVWGISLTALVVALIKLHAAGLL
ncbi:hypothetical protein [Amycolatopsis taiwanensis]|uniref:hypothetical protein n=1 Tax=Amycolatopsis taiwanensis TaxID=342230 RepID=UPI0004826BF1|nr:hypothetical protein [Amycolatopsis taiwanensis]